MVLLDWDGKTRPTPLEVSSRGGLVDNLLLLGDNQDALVALGDRGVRPHLVYLDPPFWTGSDFGDYQDAWPSLDAYLQMLYERLGSVRDLLADDGALFVHLDWHAAAYVRVMLDEIFGRECFRNEIAWAYRRWPAKARAFQRLHDTILFYVKDPERYTWNQLYEPLSSGTVRTHGDRRQVAVFDGKKRVNSVDTDEPSPGTPMTDVWTVSVLNARARERTGYATQKPEALLERIVRATTRPGDIVADFFCGSGTTLAVAHKTGRRWIGCDRSERAIALSAERLESLGAGFDTLEVQPSCA